MRIGARVKFKQKTKGLHARLKKRFEEHGKVLGIVTGIRQPGICTIMLTGPLEGLSYQVAQHGPHFTDVLERHLTETEEISSP